MSQYFSQLVLCFLYVMCKDVDKLIAQSNVVEAAL